MWRLKLRYSSGDAARKSECKYSRKKPSTFAARCSDRFDIICREMIFVTASVHGARVTTPALMDLPLTCEAIPRVQTDMGVEHLNQFTDTHE